MQDLRFVYITASSASEAETIGRKLVEGRLAACANVLPGMRSFYWWQGRVETSEEAVLVCKTSTACVDALIEAVKNAHSYEIPCVVTLPLLEGNPEYANWLRDSLSAR
jgi:periplasmic divalent cation tolerance protein